jgi:methionyl-tRNA synthetase
VSTLGWPASAKVPAGKALTESEFEKYWGTKDAPKALQFAGKDNLRQQSAMWQAMLMSAGLPTSRQIVIHGFITSGGQKMSKSLGNVIDPLAIVDEYGTDALRYYLARHIHPFEDSDFTMEKFKEAYNANLANGIGNLVARVMRLAEKNEKLRTKTRPRPNVPFGTGGRMDSSGRSEKRQFKNQKIEETASDKGIIYHEAIKQYNIQQAADAVWDLVQAGDQYVTEMKPWEGEKTEVIVDLVLLLDKISDLLAPLMPQTSAKIKTAVEANKMPEPLFVRK